MAGKLLYNKANRITTVSNFCKREVSEIYGVPEERIDVIPNGVRIDFFKQCSKNEKDKIMEQYNFEKALLFIKPIPRKGLHLLIRALPAILKEVPGLKLLVVGGISTNATYYKFCYNLSQRFHVKDRVLFIGWVDDVDLPKYFTVASALVLPSLYEASPITVLESMACGTPVCASKGLGLSEIITDGKDGFLVDPTNATSLAEALITLLTDNSLRQRMSFNTRKKIERHYSWDYIAEQYLRAYNKTINFELKPVF
jgi:glycosyltransferase involved in cell wall biosynthesis